MLLQMETFLSYVFFCDNFANKKYLIQRSWEGSIYNDLVFTKMGPWDTYTEFPGIGDSRVELRVDLGLCSTCFLIQQEIN